MRVVHSDLTCRKVLEVNILVPIIRWWLSWTPNLGHWVVNLPCCGHNVPTLSYIPLLEPFSSTIKLWKNFISLIMRFPPLSVFTQRQIAFSTCPSSLSTLHGASSRQRFQPEPEHKHVRLPSEARSCCRFYSFPGSEGDKAVGRKNKQSAGNHEASLVLKVGFDWYTGLQQMKICIKAIVLI